MKSCTRLRSVLNRAAVKSMTKTHKSVEEKCCKDAQSKSRKNFLLQRRLLETSDLEICMYGIFIRFWVEKDVLKDLKYPSEAIIDEMHRSVYNVQCTMYILYSVQPMKNLPKGVNSIQRGQGHSVRAFLELFEEH